MLGLLPGCTGFSTGHTDTEPARVNEVKSARLTTAEGLCDSLVGDLMRVGDFIMNSVVVVVVMRRREQARKKEEVIRANTFNLIELVDLKLFVSGYQIGDVQQTLRLAL